MRSTREAEAKNGTVSASSRPAGFLKSFFEGREKLPVVFSEEMFKERGEGPGGGVREGVQRGGASRCCRVVDGGSNQRQSVGSFKYHGDGGQDECLVLSVAEVKVRQGGGRKVELRGPILGLTMPLLPLGRLCCSPRLDFAAEVQEIQNDRTSNRKEEGLARLGGRKEEGSSEVDVLLLRARAGLEIPACMQMKDVKCFGGSSRDGRHG